MSLSGVSGSGSSALLAQLQQVFKSADVNNDGQLSSDEFAALGQKLQAGGNNASSPTSSSPSQSFSSDTLSSLLSGQQTQSVHRHHHGGGAAKMFADADANGDGKVTASELTTSLAAHAPAGASATSDAPSASDIAAEMIKSGDTDGDGSLSLSEMQAMKPPGGAHGPGGPPPAEATGSSSASASASKTYDPADTNKDGTVSSAELLASLQSAISADGAATSASSSFGLLAKLLSQLTSATSTSTGAGAATTTTSVTA
jgi:Ca2+-binding EF-hand superfamily protein